MSDFHVHVINYQLLSFKVNYVGSFFKHYFDDWREIVVMIMCWVKALVQLGLFKGKLVFQVHSRCGFSQSWIGT